MLLIVHYVCIPGGAFEGVEDKVSPFGYGRGEGADAGHGETDWICSKEKPNTDNVFRSLNPVDGKVTGAGNHTLLTRALTHSTPIAATRAVAQPISAALEALLASARNSSLLAELYMSARDSETDRLDTIVDALSTTTRNTNLIAQILNHAQEAHENQFDRTYSSLSIHSLDTLTDASLSRRKSVESINDTISFKGFDCLPDGDEDDRPRSETDYHQTSSNESGSDDESSDDKSDSSEANFVTNDEKVGKQSFFRVIFDGVKLVFLMLLNVVTTLITLEVMFLSLVFVFTGDRSIHFSVDRPPEGWVDRARELAFGPDEQIVSINSFAEIFYRDNFVNILKYIIRWLRSAPQ